MNTIFHWEAAPYQSPQTAQTCDIASHRLYVRRTAKRARTFLAIIDGRRIPGTFLNIGLAKAAAEREFEGTR